MASGWISHDKSLLKFHKVSFGPENFKSPKCTDKQLVLAIVTEITLRCLPPPPCII
jgi:hypothetical protein